MNTAPSGVCTHYFVIVLLYFQDELPSMAVPNTVDQIKVINIRQYLYKYLKVYEDIYTIDF